MCMSWSWVPLPSIFRACCWHQNLRSRSAPPLTTSTNCFSRTSISKSRSKMTLTYKIWVLCLIFSQHPQFTLRWSPRVGSPDPTMSMARHWLVLMATSRYNDIKTKENRLVRHSSMEWLLCDLGHCLAGLDLQTAALDKLDTVQLRSTTQRTLNHVAPDSDSGWVESMATQKPRYYLHLFQRWMDRALEGARRVERWP